MASAAASSPATSSAARAPGLAVGILGAARAGPCARKKQQRPAVNVFGAPEALQSAGGVSTLFEERCRQLYGKEIEEQGSAPSAWAEEDAEDADSVEGGRPEAEASADTFPLLEASLVQAILSEAESLEAAAQILTALSDAAAAEVAPEAGDQGAKAAEPAEQARCPAIDVCDEALFPVLLGADGWQVVGKGSVAEGSEEAEDRTWSARARAARDLPQPAGAKAASARSSASAAAGPGSRFASTALAGVPARRATAARCAPTEPRDADDAEGDTLTIWELRQKLGQHRARRLARHPDVAAVG